MGQAPGPSLAGCIYRGPSDHERRSHIGAGPAGSGTQGEGSAPNRANLAGLEQDFPLDTILRPLLAALNGGEKAAQTSSDEGPTPRGKPLNVLDYLSSSSTVVVE